MTTGDIVIVSFPFTDLTSFKARPAVVISKTPDFNDIIVSLISSVLPSSFTELQILLPADKVNNLRTNSVIKVYRITTVESRLVLHTIGKLNDNQLSEFKDKFRSLVD